VFLDLKDSQRIVRPHRHASAALADAQPEGGVQYLIPWRRGAKSCPPRARRASHARRFTVIHGATGSGLDLCNRRSSGRSHHLMQAGDHARRGTATTLICTNPSHHQHPTLARTAANCSAPPPVRDEESRLPKDPSTCPSDISGSRRGPGGWATDQHSVKNRGRPAKAARLPAVLPGLSDRRARLPGLRPHRAAPIPTLRPVKVSGPQAAPLDAGPEVRARRRR
jgi:hypothetical protein